MIKNLALPDGRVTQDENKIIQGVFYHCRNLYRKDPMIDTFIVARAVILGQITKKFLVVDNLILWTLPNDEEIEKVILTFLKAQVIGRR